MKKIFLTIVIIALTCTNSYALLINPGASVPVLTGLETSQSKINKVLVLFGVELPEVYKSDFVKNTAVGTDSGYFADFYTTTYSEFAESGPKDPSGAELVWNLDSTSWITNAKYLLVKGGKQTPAWYLFDIFGWDGQETITLSGFWPGEVKGAISHVSIYRGKSGTAPVPEPATMLLFGAGLAGLAAVARRRKG